MDLILGAIAFWTMVAISIAAIIYSFTIGIGHGIAAIITTIVFWFLLMCM